MKFISKYNSGLALYVWRSLFFLIISIQVSTVVAQTSKNDAISLDIKDRSLNHIFKEIESLTDYQFSYGDEIINYSGELCVIFKDASLDEILDDIAQKAPIEYKIHNNKVSVRKAEKTKITGKVTDGVTGESLVGVTIYIKGTLEGTITDIQGEYSLSAYSNSTIQYSYIGYTKTEESVANRKVIDIALNPGSTDLDEVVVTALGITREEKSLGYAVTEVKAVEMTRSVSGNWLNGLNGKVAGLTFDNAGTGPSGSIRVTLRGDQSLNYGNNEALFVIDGIPVSSGMTSTSSGSTYANNDAPVDYGNGVSDINPDDIESVSILKGPAAAALYGSRAANGAIIITTKSSSRKSKGIGVTINSSVSFEQAGYFPDFQTEYGMGNELGEDPYSMWTLTEKQSEDGIAVQRNYSSYAFGEKFDANQMRYLYASKDWETSTFSKLPWVYQDDWYTGLFKTGITHSNSISIDGSNGKETQTRLSFTNYRNDWILPNTGFNRNSLSLTINTKVNDIIDIRTNVNYNKKTSDNMPGGGYSAMNPMYSLAWGYNVNSTNEWKDEYFEDRFNYRNWSSLGENGQGLVIPTSSSSNPYRTLYECLYTQDKDRVIGSVAITAHLAEHLDLDIRSGLDWYNDFRTQRKPFYTPKFANGFYREQKVGAIDMNTDIMLRYSNLWAANRLGVSVMLGGNNMSKNYQNTKITLNELGDEDIYNVSNLPTGVSPDLYNYRSRKEVNSMYGMLSLSWEDKYFLDVTGRNDWSSTLTRGNWSYFYPSIAASVLLNETFNFQANAPWVNMLKLRVSWANVGNDTSPYALDKYYSETSYSGGYELPGTIPDPNLQPENIESWELGMDGRFFKNRIRFDIALYNSSATNQIVSAKLDQITGATSMKINTGEITNKGIELAATFVPVRTRNFSWAFDATWSKNINKLVSIQDGWDPAEPLQTSMGTTIGGRTYIYSYVGEEMHYIYGRGFQRAPEGATYTDSDGNEVDASGMHIVNADGYPILDDNPETKIARVNPDWRGSITQRFKYKNFSLSGTFTGQMGGNAFSVTNFALSYTGKLNNSLEGRNDGLVHKGVNVIENEDGTISYTENKTVTKNIKTYYNTYIWNRNNTEMNTFSTTFLKLKEVRFDYALPQTLIKRTGFLQNASLGIFATNVFCITDFPQYDPETGMLNGSNIQKGIETMSMPMTRTYGLNIKLSF